MVSLNVLVKWILSYTKSAWDFDDYPIKVLHEQRQYVIGKQYYVNMENWAEMVTCDLLKERAIEKLKAKYESYKSKNKLLPRPGTRVQIGFASTEEIDNNEKLAYEYLKRIFTQDIVQTTITFISDETCLDDFVTFSPMSPENYKTEIIKRTLSIYGVDITEMYEESVFQILRFINNANNCKQEM